MKTKDPFPTQGRYRERYTPVELDPLEMALAKKEAEDAEIRRNIANGKHETPDPADLRGIPIIGRGVTGRVKVHRDELHR